MKSQLALAVAFACALPACSSGTGGPVTPPSPTLGTDPAPSNGSEPTAGGAEPVVSGQDRPPGSTMSIPQMCAAVCARLATACGGGGTQADCAAQCTSEVSAAGMCQPAYLDFVRCLETAPFTCDANNNLEVPDCNDEILALAQCMGVTTTPTAGSSGSAGSAP
jgi:hypothetical protein